MTVRPGLSTTRPLGVRCINPFFRRYGSYTSSIVPASSPTDAASVSSPHRSSLKLLDHCQKKVSVNMIQPVFIYIQKIQRIVRHLFCNNSIIFHLCKIPGHALKDGSPDAEFLWNAWPAPLPPFLRFLHPKSLPNAG